MANIKSTKETTINLHLQLTEHEAEYLRAMFQNRNGAETNEQTEIRRQMFVALGGAVARCGVQNGD